MERILDTSAIDMTDEKIKSELNIDLRRMDKLEHDKAPEGSNAYYKELFLEFLVKNTNKIYY